ncbi:MAG: CooT family nickel-binding protein [Desulfatiglans sp.]|jgi:predicted RNA-binding protein|nr:CooT family nickel-binding protein [Thermodesulfobacteriota bacterium]MEE4351475.1 CooT family nickel-binding protein [Desulfatiglans sp.]
MMCESTAYILRNDEEELFMDYVQLLENMGNEVRIVNIFGEEKRIEARTKTLSLVDHKILFNTGVSPRKVNEASGSTQRSFTLL